MGFAARIGEAIAHRLATEGAGVAILYVAFFAGHALYGLFPLALTFAGMALVTVVAGLLAGTAGGLAQDSLAAGIVGIGGLSNMAAGFVVGLLQLAFFYRRV